MSTVPIKIVPEAHFVKPSLVLLPGKTQEQATTESEPEVPAFVKGFVGLAIGIIVIGSIILLVYLRGMVSA